MTNNPTAKDGFLKGVTDGSDKCECYRCIIDKDLRGPVLFPGRTAPVLSFTKMILCGECGNKRCPKASDHRLECTQSNEPGQPGSVYR